MVCAWRTCHPHILTDFRRYDQLFHRGCLKQKPRTKRHFFTVKQDFSRHIRPCRKLTHLIELTIVRKKCLCRQSQDFSPAKSCCHIVELCIHHKRHAHKHKHVLLSCKLCDFKQCLFCCLQKYILCKQIPACISCDTQFWKYHDLCLIVLCFFNGTAYLFCIKRHIRHPDIRCGSCHFDKSLFHSTASLSLFGHITSICFFSKVPSARLQKMYRRYYRNDILLRYPFHRRSSPESLFSQH